MYKKIFVLGIIILFIEAAGISGTGGSIGDDVRFNEKSMEEISSGLGVDDWFVVETVGYWSFDEGGGDVAFDASHYDNKGYCYDTLWIPGSQGQGYALSFSKIKNSAVIVDDNPSLDFDDLDENQGFMIELWMKQYSSPPYPCDAGLVCKGAQEGYYLAFKPDNNVIFWIGNGISGHTILSNTKIT